jgi:hypothetical protein
VHPVSIECYVILEKETGNIEVAVITAKRYGKRVAKMVTGKIILGPPHDVVISPQGQTVLEIEIERITRLPEKHIIPDNVIIVAFEFHAGNI